MVFLGRMSFGHGGKYLSINGSRLELASVPPDSVSAQFLAYDVGGGRLQLMTTNGQWLYLSSTESPIAWYPVLYSAGTAPYATPFQLSYLDLNKKTFSFNFATTTGDPVTLLLSVGQNPYCWCYFDVGIGWGTSVQFGVTIFTPGVPDLQRTKNGAGIDFGCIGNACVDLSGADLSGVDLTGAKFAGSSLGSTSFAGATLDRASLVKAKVNESTSFLSASMKGTDFSGIDLSGNTKFSTPPAFSTDINNRTKFANATIEASIIGHDWSFLDLTGAKIKGLPKDLSGLQAREALLGELDLGAADASGAYGLENASFSRSTMTGARLQYAVLINADLDGVKLQGASLVHADLTSVRLTGGANLGKDGEHDGADLSFATILQTDMTGANLDGVKLDHATVGYGTLFTSASLRGASLVEADLTGISLAGAPLEKADLRRANLTKCNLTGAKLGAGARLDGAALMGTDLTNADLDGTVLTDAVLATGPGSLFRPNSQPLAYEKTILPDTSTDATTVCPSTEAGPCSGEKLVFKTMPSNMSEVKNANGKLLGYSWRNDA